MATPNDMSEYKSISETPILAGPRMAKKAEFIRKLAGYLVGNQAGKSIALEMEQKRVPVVEWAKEWAEVRNASPVFGYLSPEEAETALWEFLG
jgi:hypothetical protein